MAESYSTLAPTQNDTQRILLGKILQVLDNGGAVGVGGVISGSGAPSGAPPAGVSGYIDTSGHHLWSWNGSTWTMIV